MCGITGIIAFDKVGQANLSKINLAVESLQKRGPDGKGVFVEKNIALGHRRLAILDTSNAANQPFADETSRFVIVFNGEIYNFKELEKKLSDKNINYKTTGDTEVLLYLYIHYGEQMLEFLNGFFAFAIYDRQSQNIFIARDRIGIKPLYYYQDEHQFIFSSEIKSITKYNIKKELDYNSLSFYFQLNYIPSPRSIYTNVRKLEAGNFIKIDNQKNIVNSSYYKIPKFDDSKTILSYSEAQNELAVRLEESVKLRLISDVPLGAFLSGGIDSSVMVALASRHTKNLNTFSIGYKDEPFFDETKYAELVAKKFKTSHHTFKLTNDDLLNEVFNVLDYIDEPFADSSAIAVYILSKQTRKFATVALSGDGADEMFAGYNKHQAHYKAMQNNLQNNIVKHSKFLLSILPKSRNNPLTNKFRQIYRFAEGLNLNDKDRYLRWASLGTEKYSFALLNNKVQKTEYKQYRNNILQEIDNKSIHSILNADMQLVLRDDMLRKVDSMSMANSLEVRTPFLDHNFVEFAMSLPEKYKVNSKIKKKILQDSFRSILPTELYKRPKHGFEVPLTKWFKNELKSLIYDDLLADNFIIEQNIFNLEIVRKIKKKLFSKNPEDVHAHIWALIVFQYWWKNNY